MVIQLRANRLLVVLLCAFVVVALCAVALPAQKAFAAQKKMPTQITSYSQTEDGAWVRSCVVKLKYNKKGDVVEAKSSFYDDDGAEYEKYSYKLKNTYKKGKLSKVTAQGTSEKHAFTFDRKGRISKDKFFIDDSNETLKYAYNKKGNIKSAKWTDDNNEYTIHKGTYTYKTTYKKGKVVKIVKSGIDKASYSEEPETFKVTQTYNKKGYLVNDDGTACSYAIKKGYVKSKTVKWGGNEIRFEYKYGKRKASKAKYINTINRDERVVVSHLASLRF